MSSARGGSAAADTGSTSEPTSGSSPEPISGSSPEPTSESTSMSSPEPTSASASAPGIESGTGSGSDSGTAPETTPAIAPEAVPTVAPATATAPAIAPPEVASAGVTADSDPWEFDHQSHAPTADERDRSEADTDPVDVAGVRSAVAAAEDREAYWRRIRRWAGVGYFVAVVLIVALAGIPTDRGSLTLVILIGLGIPCLGRGWAAFRRVLIDWLPFTAALIVYDYSRGLAHLFGQPLHMSDIASIDRDVFGVIPTVWLQDRYLTPGAVHWYDAAATLIYLTHFLATPILAAVLWLKNRDLWLAFVRRVLGLAVAGLVTYILFPAAPPWYASRKGVIGPVIRGSGRGWFWLHINHAGNLLQEGQAASNQVAAMPSLHTGYATIIALFVLATVRSRLAWLILLYPAAMGLSLVYLGEHYVVDVVAGVVYALVINAVMSAWENWYDTRRARARARAAPSVTSPATTAVTPSGP